MSQRGLERVVVRRRFRFIVWIAAEADAAILDVQGTSAILGPAIAERIGLGLQVRTTWRLSWGESGPRQREAKRCIARVRLHPIGQMAALTAHIVQREDRSTAYLPLNAEEVSY